MGGGRKGCVSLKRTHRFQREVQDNYEFGGQHLPVLVMSVVLSFEAPEETSGTVVRSLKYTITRLYVYRAPASPMAKDHLIRRQPILLER